MKHLEDDQSSSNSESSSQEEEEEEGNLEPAIKRFKVSAEEEKLIYESTPELKNLRTHLEKLTSELEELEKAGKERVSNEKVSQREFLSMIQQ